MTHVSIDTKRREFLGTSAIAISAAALGATAMTLPSPSTAADYKKNPFTLVYGDAITQNLPGKVNIHPVKYKLGGLDIVANVYTPANFDPARKYLLTPTEN